ncbi:hypothetical protein QBC34DRAFT_395404 [Podospora aff. communis PSN243]|uniref:Cytochrome b mRNA-processing protein 4 n=1 Tax=Podospora aff. communis PSN243 TaxID=3040156 RepID=A0AAV9GYP4_9PEZI|nr:hypothetical protein QBC34DRAFT_395404 [Podospora aff. communis PSN243]
MASKGRNWRLYAKMLGVGVAVCVGGPAFTLWVSPTEDELFKKYNPELQKRSLEGRYEKQKEFDDFVSNLKRLAKSDKAIWYVQKDEEERRSNEAKAAKRMAEKTREAAVDPVKEEMRREAGLSK